MSEMIERVARLLASEVDQPNPADNPGLTGDDGTRYPPGVPRWKVHEEWARDIIAAMREPTAAMIVAGTEAAEISWGRDGVEDGAALESWQAMHAAALK